MKAKIIELHAGRVAGVRGIWNALRRRGEVIGRDQVARLMRELGLGRPRHYI